MRYLLQTGATPKQASQAVYTQDGAYVGMALGRVIVPCPIPDAWVPAPFQAWQMAYVQADGRWLYGFPFHARGVIHAILTYQAIREDAATV